MSEETGDRYPQRISVTVGKKVAFPPTRAEAVKIAMRAAQKKKVRFREPHFGELVV